MHEHSSGRGRRLPAGSGKLAVTVGACLCAGQLLVGSAAPASLPEPPRAAAAPITTTDVAAERAAALSGQAARTSRRTAERTPVSRADLPAARKTAAREAAAREAAARKAADRKAASRPRTGTIRITGGGTGARVVALAATLIGSPYRYGAAGPRAFDCSGFTQYVFRRFGRSLPHNADAQENLGWSVSRSQARLGDLVFFRSGSHAYHVGIYAGNGYMIDSPSSGRSVSKRKIWNRSYVVRRVIG